MLTLTVRHAETIVVIEGPSGEVVGRITLSRLSDDRTRMHLNVDRDFVIYRIEQDKETHHGPKNE